MSDIFSEIKNWSIDAIDEDNERYFFQLDAFDAVINGKYSVVLGRKGSGKTAIFERVRSLEAHDRHVSAQNFSGKPILQLLNFKDKKFSLGNQYLYVWKHIIYSEIVKKLLFCENLNFDIRHILNERFPVFLDRQAEVLKQPRSSKFTVGIFNLTYGEETGQLQDRNYLSEIDVLEEIIIQSGCTDQVRILFDGLDEDFRNLIDRSTRDYINNEHLLLMSGLIKAAISCNQLMARHEIQNISTTVFLSSDIFELIHDRDKNKWSGHCYVIQWAEFILRKFVAFRISRALAKNGHTLSFNDAWASIFADRIIHMPDGKIMNLYTYVQQKTLHRPRDFIAFFLACVKDRNISSDRHISTMALKNAEVRYSTYLRQEFIDEIFPMIPQIGNIIDVFSIIRKQIFSADDFDTALRSADQQGILKVSELDLTVPYILRICFRYGMIGNYAETGNSKSQMIFNYTDPGVAFDVDKPMIFHPGLFKSLGVSRYVGYE